MDSAVVALAVVAFVVLAVLGVTVAVLGPENSEDPSELEESRGEDHLTI